jgi:hypothetical protein
MPARTPSKSKNAVSSQLAIRVPHEWISRLDALAKRLARNWEAPTRSEAVKAALIRGLEAFEAEAPPAPAAPAPEPVKKSRRRK